ncbi:ricin B lectin domain-containing protein [Mycena sanguinolenta]|nr:ricin B lectin domain-containing protein [Mycena sanguinolenta]
MFSSPVFVLLGFYLSAVAAVEIQSLSPSFASAGFQGCIATTENADGAPLIIHNCNTESTENQDWDLAFYNKESEAGPQPITIFGGEKCIDVTNGVNADGTPLQIWTCIPGSANQKWISVADNTLEWAGTNKCIDLTNGLITDGNVLQIWTCASNDNQKWTGASEPQSNATGTVNIYGGAAAEFCITPASNADGAQVAVATCGNFATTFPNGNITWSINIGTGSPGSISTYGGEKCLDVPNGSTVNGVKLQIWDCVAGNTNQIFTVKDGNPSQIEWNGTGKCIDLTDGNSSNGNLIQLWDCTDADTNQVWYHSPAGQ